MLRRGLVCMNVPSRRVSRSGNFQLGVLLRPSLFVVLISLLCYLGQAVEIRKQLGWMHGLGCGFFRGAFQEENFCSSLAVSGDWVKKGSYQTAWSVPGDSLC